MIPQVYQDIKENDKEGTSFYLFCKTVMAILMNWSHVQQEPRYFEKIIPNEPRIHQRVAEICNFLFELLSDGILKNNNLSDSINFTFILNQLFNFPYLRESSFELFVSLVRVTNIILSRRI